MVLWAKYEALISIKKRRKKKQPSQTEAATDRLASESEHQNGASLARERRFLLRERASLRRQARPIRRRVCKSESSIEKKEISGSRCLGSIERELGHRRSLNLDQLRNKFSKQKKTQDRTTFEAVATDHLRLSGVYWGLATLAMLGKLDEGGPGLDREEVAAFVSSCAREGAEGVVSTSSGSRGKGSDGGSGGGEERKKPAARSVGFGGAERHDAHLLYTLSAVQVAALIDRMDLIDADAVMSCEMRETF